MKRSLDELVAGMSELEPGVEYPVADNWCKACRSEELVLVMKLHSSGGSLAGVQPKITAYLWPWLCCKGCGRESKGERA